MNGDSDDFDCSSTLHHLVAYLLCAALIAHGAHAASDTFNAPALKVNTQVISIREVETIFADSYVLIQDRLKRGELSESNHEAAIRLAWAEALETATHDKIIDQRADKRRKDILKFYLERAGQNLTGEQAMTAFKRLEGDYVRRLRRELIAAAGGEEELRATLRRRGQTMQEWEAGLGRELFRRDVLSIELGPIISSPAAIKTYYEKHPEFFSQYESWRLRRIRISKAKFSSNEVALDAARLVKQKLSKGAGFAELAAKASDDSEFSKQGGILSREGNQELPAGSFPDEEKIAASLKDGEVSEPVDIGQWYVLVKRDSHRPASVLSFEQSSEKAEALAYAEKLKQKKQELFEKLKGESYVEIIQKDPPAHLLKAAAKRDEFIAPDK